MLVSFVTLCAIRFGHAMANQSTRMVGTASHGILGLPVIHEEKVFWWSLNRGLLAPLDIIVFIMKCSHVVVGPRGLPVLKEFHPWFPIMTLVESVLLIWCLAARRHYIKNRMKGILVLRALQVLACYNIAKSLSSTSAMERFDSVVSSFSPWRLVMYHHVVAPGSIFLFQTCLVCALPFMQSALFQTMSLGPGLIYVIPTVSRILASGAPGALTMRLFIRINTLVRGIMSIFCSHIVLLYPIPNPEESIPPRQAALTTLTFFHLYVGLVVPLYLVYEVEKVCKLKFMRRHLHHSDSDRLPGATSPLTSNSLSMVLWWIGCIYRHALLLTALMVFTWTMTLQLVPLVWPAER